MKIKCTITQGGYILPFLYFGPEHLVCSHALDIKSVNCMPRKQFELQSYLIEGKGLITLQYQTTMFKSFFELSANSEGKHCFFDFPLKSKKFLCRFCFIF